MRHVCLQMVVVMVRQGDRERDREREGLRRVFSKGRCDYIFNQYRAGLGITLKETEGERGERGGREGGVTRQSTPKAG